MLWNGEGTEKDSDEAFELFKQSAEGGYSRGIMMLGYCYNNGIGTDKDSDKVIYWYRKALNNGTEEAKDRINNILIW